MYFIIAFVVQLLHSGSNDETIVDNVLDVDDTSDPDVVLQYGKIIW